MQTQQILDIFWVGFAAVGARPSGQLDITFSSPYLLSVIESGTAFAAFVRTLATINLTRQADNCLHCTPTFFSLRLPREKSFHSLKRFYQLVCSAVVYLHVGKRKQLRIKESKEVHATTFGRSCDKSSQLKQQGATI